VIRFNRPEVRNCIGPVTHAELVEAWTLFRDDDDAAGQIMIRDFCTHYFGARKRLTKDRCEEFFSNDANFIDV
jgi:1,4-dihydroxy-2-naphthoyl-CoA synthase